MNFIKALNPEGLQNYNPVVSTINLNDSSLYSTTDELREIRDIIGITNSAYDFGLQAALISVNSYPEILKQTGEKNLIGYIASYDRPSVTINSGKLLPIGNQFNINFRPYKVFKNLNLTITYLDEKRVTVKLDEDIWVVPYEENRGLLIVHFPEELNDLRFSVELFQLWQDFSSITIGLAPNSYPFREVIKNLNESQAFINVCNKQGLLDTFLSIPELPYKLAIATLSVYKEQISL